MLERPSIDAVVGCVEAGLERSSRLVGFVHGMGV
jgi:hypothetical protein